MSWLSPYRWLLVGGLVIALWGWHWNDKRIAVADAIAVVQAEQVAVALAASEAARAKEAELQSKVTKVANDYQTEKKRRAADAVITAGRVSDLKAALDSATAENPPAPGGTDDPRNAIIHQCTSALIGMDEYAKDLADKTGALQSYARDVCLAK